MHQWDTEDVETVAGIVRLLRRAAELSWILADAGGPRSSHQLFAVGIDTAAEGPRPGSASAISGATVASTLHRGSAAASPCAAVASVRAGLGGELRCRCLIGAPWVNCWPTATRLLEKHFSTSRRARVRPW